MEIQAHLRLEIARLLHHIKILKKVIIYTIHCSQHYNRLINNLISLSTSRLHS